MQGVMILGDTFAQKILANRSGNDHVVPGQIVTLSPDHLLTHDNTAAIIGKISVSRWSRLWRVDTVHME